MFKTFAAAIFFSGAATVAFAQQLDAAAPSTTPMPGFRDGDAGARKLRYRCTGEGAPTVLIETGGGTSFETLVSWEREHNFRPGWLDVVAGMEKATRVCVYDRAGVGRSGKAPMPRTSVDVAADLFALLHNEKIPTPIVCVGQSFGGSNCRIFASRYPKLVAGMVLVDTSDADFWTRMKLPAPDLTKSAEWIDLEANASLLRNAKRIGDKPLVVLTASPTATDPMIPEAQQADATRIHQELQRELLGLSTHSRQVIATKAGHNIQREEPQIIVDAVLEVVASAAHKSKRAPQPVSDCCANFGMDVNPVLGPNAVDCGWIDAKHNTTAARSKGRKAVACVRRAQARGRPLIVGQGFSVSPDYFLANYAVFGALGEKVLVQIEQEHDGPMVFAGRCDVLKVLDNGDIEHSGCQQTDEALLDRMKLRK